MSSQTPPPASPAAPTPGEERPLVLVPPPSIPPVVLIPPPPPPSPSRRLWLLAGLLLLVVAGAVVGFMWHSHQLKLRPADVLVALNSELGAGRIKFTDITFQTEVAPANGQKVAFQAKGVLAESLYLPRETATAIRERFPEHFARLQSLTAEIGTPAGQRVSELAKLGEPPADPLACALLDRTAEAGMEVRAGGAFSAARVNGNWRISFIAPEILTSIPPGKPRAEFPAKSLLVADASSRADLEKMVLARIEYATKYERGRNQLSYRIQQERNSRQAALLVAVQPGSLFRGKAEPLELSADKLNDIVFEITSCDQRTREVTALLRLADGWTDARVFSARWEADEDFTSLRIPLSTRASQAIPDAGPLIGARDSWTIDLALDPQGRLTGPSASHQYTLARIPSALLENVRDELSAAHRNLFAATAPGTIYCGTVVPKTGGPPETAILGFTRQDNNGARLEAELELQTLPGRFRTYRGYVSANPRRTGERPIRLTSEASRRAKRAPSDTLVGLTQDITTSFSWDGLTLIGSDDLFEYKLVQAAAAELNDIAAARQAQRAASAALLPPGLVLAGVARYRDGFSVPLRLRIIRLEDDGSIEADCELSGRPEIHMGFAGMLDFARRRIQLTSTTGHTSFSGDTRVPFLVRNIQFGVTLGFAGTLLEGAIDGDTDWNLSFEMSKVAVGTDIYPTWPKSPGTYLLSRGAWRLLPVKGGLFVAARGTDSPKTAELVFEGTDPAPDAPYGLPLAVVCIGPYPQPDAAQLAQHPELRDYPGLEVAFARRSIATGKRTADLFAVTPDIVGFQSSRLAAKLITPAKGVSLLVTATPPPPGTYALLVGGFPYEIAVR